MKYCLYCGKLLERKSIETLSAWSRRIFCDVNCRRHMSHYKTHGNPSTRTSKKCPSCKENKLLNNFPYNKKRVDGRGEYCLICKRIKSRLIKTGWTEEQYKAVYKEQNGQCAIDGCNKGIEAADHDHQNKKIRGLLCRKHNVILYYFDEKKEFNSIINYLRKYDIYR